MTAARGDGGGGGARSLPVAEGGGASAALRKARWSDDRAAHQGEQHRPTLPSRVERGRKKLRDASVSLFSFFIHLLKAVLFIVM